MVFLGKIYTFFLFLKYKLYLLHDADVHRSILFRRQGNTFTFLRSSCYIIMCFGKLPNYHKSSNAYFLMRDKTSKSNQYKTGVDYGTEYSVHILYWQWSILCLLFFVTIGIVVEQNVFYGLSKSDKNTTPFLRLRLGLMQNWMESKIT